ncbi:MAG: MFS transporter [Rickettsiales bacterium]|jgi:MFS family permease|nr:MFS transporter [Rickettsiales bacterium]
MNERDSFLLRYLAIYFFHGFFFMKHYLGLLLGSELGPREAGLIIFTFSVVSLLLEVATSAVSDYFGSRNTILFGMALYLLGYILLLFRKNFLTFCVFYGSYGLYETLFTGARETLVYNNVKYFDIMDNFVLQKNRAKILQYMALILASLIAGKMKARKIGANYLIVTDIVILLLYILTVYLTDEHSNENLKKLNTNYLRSVKNGFKYMFRHGSLRKIVEFRFVWFSIHKLFLHYAPTFYIGIWKNNLNIASYMVPVEVFSAAVLQGLFLRYFARRKNIRLDAALLVVSSLSAMLSSIVYSGLVSYILMIIYFTTLQMGEIIFFMRMQKFIPSKSRAVIISACNFFNSAIGLIMTLVVKSVSERYSYRLAFIGITTFFSASAILFYISIMYDGHLERVDRRTRLATKIS